MSEATATFDPAKGSASSASLDRSKPVSPKLDEGGERPVESFAEYQSPTLRFCPLMAIRTALQVDGGEFVIQRVDYQQPCGRWACDVCGPKKRWKLILRIEAGLPNRFMTLTTRPNENESPREVFVRTSKKVSKLFRWLKGTDPDIRFARILESTAAGFPHYHFCLHSKWISQSNLSVEWERLTGAKIVDIRKLNGRTIRYISKYISKSDAVAYTRQRVSFSRNWPKLENESHDDDWELAEWNTIHRDEIESYLARADESERMIDLGKTVTGLGEGPSNSKNIEALIEQFGRTPVVVGRAKPKKELVLEKHH